MQTLIPQIDKLVRIEPGDIVFAGGDESAIEAMASGLVMTAESVQWIRLTDKPFVPPKPSVEVFDWNSQKREGIKPKPNTFIVLDGIHLNTERFNWDPMVSWIDGFAKSKKTPWLILAPDENGTRTDPTKWLPQTVMDEIRKYARYEIVFAQRHFAEILCEVHYPTDGSKPSQTIDLGPPGDLAKKVIQQVQATVKPAQKSG